MTVIALVVTLLVTGGVVLGVRAVQSRDAACEQARNTPVMLGTGRIGLSEGGKQRRVRDTVILLNAGCFAQDQVKAAAADLVTVG